MMCRALLNVRFVAARAGVFAVFLSVVQFARGQAASQPSQQVSDSPAVGIAVVGIDDEVKAAWRKDKIPPLQERGLFVAKVRPGSPAARAGIKPIDVLVVRSEGKALVTPEQFSDWVSTLKVGRRYRLIAHRPLANDQGRMIWKKINVSIEPATRAKVEEAALRYGYLRVDDGWMELPGLDFSNPSSQSRPFVPPKERYYELPGGSTMATSDPSRAPRGARDITQRVISDKRREWDERLPRIAVGEHGKIIGFEIIQVLGKSDAIVQIGLVPDRYEWIRLTGVQTTGLVDGRRATFEEPIAIVGTWDYTTTLGARKTIFLAAPVQALQRGLSDEEVKQLRTWLDAPGRP